MENPHYTIAEGVAWEKLGSGIVVFKLKQGEYFRFNDTGSFIWKKLADEITPGQIIEELKAKYGNRERDYEKDFHGFIEEVLAEGLIVEDGTA